MHLANITAVHNAVNGFFSIFSALVQRSYSQSNTYHLLSDTSESSQLRDIFFQGHLELGDIPEF